MTDTHSARALVFPPKTGSLFHKMASTLNDGENLGKNVIAMDLLAKINAIPYHQVISLLNYGDTVSEEDFENHPVSKFFWLDLRECFLKNKNRDPDNLFTLFGNYSLDNADTVRHKLTKHMEEDIAYYDSVACVALSFKNVTMKYWIEDTSEALTFGDEICLYALCRMYDRHAMVYTQTKAWSTMAMIEPSDYLNAIAKCDIHLLHMGRGIYGRLKRKPLVAPPSNKFTHPKIHVKIDRRRKTSRVEDLRCPDKRYMRPGAKAKSILNMSQMALTVSTRTMTKSAQNYIATPKPIQVLLVSLCKQIGLMMT